MRFGTISLDDAEGATLAHSVTTAEGRLRKGTRLGREEVARLRAAGLAEVVAARLGPGDVPEDEAARIVADALTGPGLEVRAPFTGRANIHATGPGIVGISRDRIDAANALTPDITVATLPEWQRVATGTMVATVKIIPYAVPSEAFAGRLGGVAGALRLHAPVLSHADLIVTTLEGAPSKSRAVTARLDRLGVACEVAHVPHETAALAAAIGASTAPLRLILTASATSDARDVGPAALLAAGGRLERFGMPVDPGNLLFLGALGAAAVIGLPGCARSPALNGADWVLERIVCGVPVTGADIAAMGVGGLLGEIPTRPQPRERPVTK
ncbi:Molybdopterin biosynthesis enzyme [Jannaschia seosinensis]|uniref:Molybdopterin biosynthesis enzyme n=1 Tax=Jannaschia seosinensis TaxID=313367 RepID=A0A0M7B8L5_9RHOB|nr:molybdopterin-binding protein [Jannaschia seosinensis]CUH30126.1 Molybdopterin biosynthesis enzyme [Jannaschia seosinensis]